MTSKDNEGSVVSEQESNLKSPDRRSMLGATAAAAAVLGTVGQAGSPALAQFSRKPAGSKDLRILIKALKDARDKAFADPDGTGMNPLKIADYVHPFRIVPKDQHDGCACGCS
jgi:hypothetical protein